MSIRFVDFYDAEDELHLAELATAAERAKSKHGTVPRDLGELDEFAEAARAHDDFAEDMEKRRVRAYVVNLPRQEWRKLLREHPPRPEVDEDKVFGVNVDEMAEALVPLSLDRDRSENLPADVDGWLASLSDAQFIGRDLEHPDGLFLASWVANNGRAMLADPTLRLASASPPTSAGTSS